MRRLAEDDHARIAAAIADAERRTAGEIVVVVAGQSDSYRILPFLWLTVAALLGGFVYAAIAPGAPAGSLALGQAIVLALAALPALVPSLRVRMVPAAIREARAMDEARRQFLSRNLSGTAGRTGILVFVSLAERFACVLADSGIDDQVADDFWEEIVDRLVDRSAAGQLADGLVEAVQACGRALAEHVPPAAGDRNELPDRVVEI